MMRSCAFSGRSTEASETKYFLSSVKRTANSLGDNSETDIPSLGHAGVARLKRFAGYGPYEKLIENDPYHNIAEVSRCG